MPQNVLIIPAYPEKSIKKVGIYCRVSSSKRDQLNSLTTQITALVREVARISQWELTDIFIDIASAKTGATRREFDRMIAACESKEISIVLTKSISRCRLPSKIQKIDAQNTKKFTSGRKLPLDNKSRGFSYIIVRISDISQPRALQISSSSLSFTLSMLLLHQSQTVEGRAFIRSQSSF